MNRLLCFASRLQYSWRAMQQMTQRLIKRLSALGQYEEAVATLNAVALERPASLKNKQASGQRSDILSVCDDAFVLAQQLTHIELVKHVWSFQNAATKCRSERRFPV